jgi:hypothetical protein
MPGKPGQSRLAAFEDEIARWVAEGISFRGIAARLNAGHGLNVTHNAVFSYVTAKRRRHRFHRSFLAAEWQRATTLVEEAHARQSARRAGSAAP